MKKILFAGLLALITLTGCDKRREETLHNETIYLQCLDAKRESIPLHGLEVFNHEGMLANLINLPAPPCDPLAGICYDLYLTADGVENRLIIEWLESHLMEFKTYRSEYTIPFKKIDSVTYITSVLEPEEKVILLYVDMDEQEFYDCRVYETITW